MINLKKQPVRVLESMRNQVVPQGPNQLNFAQNTKNIDLRPDQILPELIANREAVFIVFDRKFEYVDEKFAKIFGYTQKEICHPDFNPLSLVAQECRFFVSCQYKEACHDSFKTRNFCFAGLSRDGRKIGCNIFLIFIPYKWGNAFHGMMRQIDEYSGKILRIDSKRQMA